MSADDVLAYDADGERVSISRDQTQHCAYCGCYVLLGVYCQCAVGRRLLAIHERILRHDPHYDEMLLDGRRLEFGRWLYEHHHVSDGEPDAAANGAS